MCFPFRHEAENLLYHFIIHTQLSQFIEHWGMTTSGFSLQPTRKSQINQWCPYSTIPIPNPLTGSTSSMLVARKQRLGVPIFFDISLFYQNGRSVRIMVTVKLYGERGRTRSTKPLRQALKAKNWSWRLLRKHFIIGGLEFSQKRRRTSY